MADDPSRTALDVLSTNWNSSNTSDTTPTFLKITDKKRLDYRGKQNLAVIAHRAIPDSELAGTGESGKNETFNIKIEVRTVGPENEMLMFETVEEIKRIIRANKLYPVPAYQLFEFEGAGSDASDGGQNFWRYVIPTKLQQFNKKYE